MINDKRLKENFIRYLSCCRSLEEGNILFSLIQQVISRTPFCSFLLKQQPLKQFFLILPHFISDFLGFYPPIVQGDKHLDSIK